MNPESIADDFVVAPNQKCGAMDSGFASTMRPGMTTSPLFFPAAFRRLFPVCGGAPNVFYGSPECSRIGDRLVIAPVENHDAAIKTVKGASISCGAVNEKQNLRIVRRRVAICNPDRLTGAIIARRMGQKTLVAISPQMRVNPLGTLARSGAHDSPPIALQRFFQQPRQYVLKGRTLKVIEKNFGHSPSAARRASTRLRFTPPSPWPTREAERTWTAASPLRNSTSSIKPNVFDANVDDR